MVMSIEDALGERNEMGSGRFVAPEGYFIGQAEVGEPGVSDLRDDGSGGTPFIPLSISIVGGPYNGEVVERNYYLSPWKDGTGFAILGGACRAFTKLGADLSILPKFGITLPPQHAGEPDNEYAANTRLALRTAYLELPVRERLKFMLAYARIAQWVGKTVVAKVRLETSYLDATGARLDAEQAERAFQSGENVRTVYNNSWGGFYGLDHTKKGKKFVMEVEYPRLTSLLTASKNEG